MASISSVTPASASQGDSLNVEIVGSGTTFDATSTVTFSHTGIAVSNVAFVDATHLTATLTIDAAAQLDASDVTVTTGAEVAIGAGQFHVVVRAKPVAALASVAPASGPQGDTVDVEITGQNTNFKATSAITFSSTGIAASNITLIDATHLSATLTIDAAAQMGVSDVIVTTDNEVATGAAIFTVMPSDFKAITLREAVNTYVREHLVTGPEKDVCLQFIYKINQSLRTGSVILSVKGA